MSLLGPDARTNMKVDTTVLDRTSEVGGRVEIVFSTPPVRKSSGGEEEG